MTGKRDDANVVVTLVRDRDLPRTIRALYGVDRARRIQRSLEPQCLSGFRKDENFRILHSDVILVADAGDFIFYDCIYEELLQSLGPINDDDTCPGPCSTTTSRWASSMSTISICSISSITRASAPA